MTTKKLKERDVILLINSCKNEAVLAVKKIEEQLGRKLKIAVIRDSRKKQWDQKADKLGINYYLTANFNNTTSIAKALLPYKDRMLAVTAYGENNARTLARIVPHVPYLRTPSSDSISWATDKIAMRELFRAYDPKITPKFIVFSNKKKISIDKIKKRVGFPLVVKPAGLASSLLVSICFHEEELDITLKKVERSLKKLLPKSATGVEIEVLIEQFMEGDMYSVDAYVGSRGRIYFCPIVAVKTGRQIGFDDFFGYQRLTPTKLKKKSIDGAKEVAAKGIRALGLRSTSVHIELMRTEDGWKVIELAPRVGGFRQTMYDLAYDIDHVMNDIMIRIPKKPKLPKKAKGYCSVMQFFAKKEGTLAEVKGFNKIKKIESLVHAKKNKKKGDRCMFAKHGGKSVMDITLFNESRSELLADIRRLEQTLIIKTK